MLTNIQKSKYENDGFICPIRVMGEEEAGGLRSKLENFELTQGGKLDSAQRNKSHLLFKWLDDLIRDPRILDPIEDLIGPDILCWNTLFWIKEAGSKSFVSWHQDTRYWGLSSDRVITAWLALSEAGVDNGCMRVMPGTHRGSVLDHEDRYDENNMLTRGQEISSGIDESLACYMPLRVGEMSIHNYRLAHASNANHGPDRRIGVSMHFLPPETAQIVGSWDSAALVRGEDKHKNFEPTPLPACDFDDQAVKFHKRATQEIRKVLYADALKNTEKL